MRTGIVARRRAAPEPVFTESSNPSADAGYRSQHLDRDRCADPHPLRRETPDQELCHRSRAAIPAPRVRSIRSVRQLCRWTDYSNRRIAIACPRAWKGLRCPTRRAHPRRSTLPYHIKGRAGRLPWTRPFPSPQIGGTRGLCRHRDSSKRHALPPWQTVSPLPRGKRALLSFRYFALV